VLARRPGGRRALPHEHDGRARLLRGREQRDEVAAGPVQVRLDEVEHERGGDGRVEGGAAPLEHRLACAGREPVRRGGHPEHALQVRARGELGRRGERHGASLHRPSGRIPA
jgi:hypothetical protein